MSVFAISDLHLSFGQNKRMDVFPGWQNYEEKIKANWNRLVKPDDTVILPGDISWGLKPEDAISDLQFIDSLNGKKIIGKGNHDLWWGTSKKVYELLNNNGITTIDILFNNAYLCENIAVCGTRGWFYDSPENEKKVIMREAGRLKASIEYGLKLGGKPIVFLHYPPVYGDFVCNEIIDVLNNYNIQKVYHGHIHGSGLNNAVSEFGNIKFKLISCDCVDFTPVPIKE